PGAASEPPNCWTASAEHSEPNFSRSSSGQPARVPSTIAAGNTSPAPVVAIAVTGTAGQDGSSPVEEANAEGPWAPSVTIASGTISASARTARPGRPARAQGIAARASGV